MDRRIFAIATIKKGNQDGLYINVENKIAYLQFVKDTIYYKKQ